MRKGSIKIAKKSSEHLCPVLIELKRKAKNEFFLDVKNVFFRKIFLNFTAT
jgi:hypothetical protein